MTRGYGGSHVGRLVIASCNPEGTSSVSLFRELPLIDQVVTNRRIHKQTASDLYSSSKYD